MIGLANLSTCLALNDLNWAQQTNANPSVNKKLEQSYALSHSNNSMFENIGKYVTASVEIAMDSATKLACQMWYRRTKRRDFVLVQTKF